MQSAPGFPCTLSAREGQRVGKIRTLLVAERRTARGVKRETRTVRAAGPVAGEPGFEPRQTESESVVLPLHHSPMDYPAQSIAYLAIRVNRMRRDQDKSLPAGRSVLLAWSCPWQARRQRLFCGPRCPAGPLPGMPKLWRRRRLPRVGWRHGATAVAHASAIPFVQRLRAKRAVRTSCDQ